jgi:nucleoside-diphosphate-sugar epimerase
MAMPTTVFLAGAGGAIGRRLVPLLLGAGHAVFGTTRSAERADDLASAGITPVVVDVFDAPALSKAVVAVRPTIVIHQLTDLPRGLDPSRMAEAAVRNARIRDEGSRNLVAAALAAGARRLIAQSIAWVYAPGPEPHSEDDPLDLAAKTIGKASIDGVAALERQILNSPPLEGIVLRYGALYGPGTGADVPPSGRPPLHVDAAASAALLTIEKGRPGIYNIAEPNSYMTTDKAERELGWDSRFRLKE